MIVVASQTLWSPTAEAPTKLVELCGLADRPCHALITEPVWDDDDPAQPISRWLDEHRGPEGHLSPVAEDLRRILQNGPRKLLNLPEVPVLQVRPGPPDWSGGRLPLDVALRLLSMPLKVMVEDKINDGAFLRHMALPGQRRALEQALDERLAELDNAGGIDGIIRQLQAAEQAIGEGSWRDRLRTWYMFDRDAHRADMTRPSEKSDEVVSRLGSEALQRPWPPRGHQLKRRAMENYVPLSLLREWWVTTGGQVGVPSRAEVQQRRAEKVSMFAGLPGVLRRQLNMKEGLAACVSGWQRKRELKEGRASLRRDELAAVLPGPLLDELLDGRDPSALDALRTGFKDVHKAWRLDDLTVERALHEDGETPDERAALEQERRALLESLLSRL